MKISSYTDKAYQSPTGITVSWPVPFLEGYAAFLKNTEHADVYLVEDEKTGITVPMQVKTVKFFRIGQLLFAPCQNAQPVNAELQQNFFNNLLQFITREK